jgi:hypothetical protein
MRKGQGRLWLGLGILVAAGCAPPPKRPLIEDQTRRVTPLPACVQYLPARRAASVGTARNLREEQLVKLILPLFDEDKRTLPQGALACTGRPVFDDPVLAGGTLVRGAWPFLEQDGDVLYGSGGDHLKIAWVKVLSFPDGTVGGPVAIVRSSERFGEVLAVGVYRGKPDRVQLATQRMGSDLLVTAQEDACVGRKPGDACENRLTILLPRMGRLARAAEIPIERVAYGAEGEKGEKGASGTLEYRLTTSADYKPDGIHLVEQIRVNDEGGRELRKAELERLFALDDIKGTMAPSEPPLWDRVVKIELTTKTKAVEPPPKTPHAPTHRH